MKTKHLFLCALFLGVSIHSYRSHRFDYSLLNKSARHPASQEKAEMAEDKNKESAKDQNSPNVNCQSESKGEKLANDVKKLIEDKEDVITKVEGDKKEEPKKEEKTAKKIEIDQSELMALLSQMTTLLTQQMQMQMHMMSIMFPSVDQSFNFGPSLQAADPSYMNLNFQDQMKIQSYGIGLQEPRFQSPYFNQYELNRQPAQISSDFGFRFGQPQKPIMQGFDFNQFHGLEQQPMPQMQRISI